MDFLGNLDALQKTLGAIALVVGVLVGFWRWMRPRMKRMGADVRAGRDALVGREAITDSITGQVLVPALPGIGVRMDTTEKNLAVMAEALKTLADTHVQVIDHEARIKSGEQRLDRLEAASEGRARLTSGEARLDRLEAASGKRVAARSTPEDETLPGIGEN